jgi:dTDP-4-dehydrorhamnose reductase
MSQPRTALIGYTGFVGANLATQSHYTDLYRSSNIGDMNGGSFDLVVCAGVQAKKWWANQNEAADWEGITKLLEVLETVSVKRFILISTVDVYPNPSGVDEFTPVDPDTNHPYGKHRYLVENFVCERFADHLVLRLPGLFGKGIKKNVIYDMLHDNELAKINPLGVYQYYCLDQLGVDITRATQLGIRLLNVASEPVSTRDIAARFFPQKRIGDETPFTSNYDMRSNYWENWNSSVPGYLYAKETVLEQLGVFLTRERPCQE